MKPYEKISYALARIGARDQFNSFRSDEAWDGLVRVAILDTSCNFGLEEIQQVIVGNNASEISI